MQTKIKRNNEAVKKVEKPSILIKFERVLLFNLELIRMLTSFIKGIYHEFSSLLSLGTLLKGFTYLAVVSKLIITLPLGEYLLPALWYANILNYSKFVDSIITYIQSVISEVWEFIKNNNFLIKTNEHLNEKIDELKDELNREKERNYKRESILQKDIESLKASNEVNENKVNRLVVENNSLSKDLLSQRTTTDLTRVLRIAELVLNALGMSTHAITLTLWLLRVSKKGWRSLFDNSDLDDATKTSINEILAILRASQVANTQRRATERAAQAAQGQDIRQSTRRRTFAELDDGQDDN